MKSQFTSIILITLLSLLFASISYGQGTLQITSPPELAGDYDCIGTDAFGGSTCNLAGTIFFAEDDTAPTTDACEPIQGSLAGFIALVDRGNCNFTSKALNAQNAGAIGVIVCNNDQANPDDVIPMGGVDPNVTIPAKMLSYNSCQTLRAYTGGEPIELVANEVGHGVLDIKALED